MGPENAPVMHTPAPCILCAELLAALEFARKWQLLETTRGRSGMPSQLMSAIGKAIAKARIELEE